ncbi:hypothetical protein, partial [Pseudomonas sp. HMWF006]|uniref:hypothetical protein n=1 Tax=Pseudomonas sp. HMWF006 TaxID=2056843 RepID=UPI001C47D546
WRCWWGWRWFDRFMVNVMASSLASQRPQVLRVFTDFVTTCKNCGTSDGGGADATNLIDKLMCNLI